MTVKTKAVEMLGETTLALPAMVADALAANDRIKYLFSVVQEARSHADHPGRDAASLEDERVAAGVASSDFDELIADAGPIGKDCYALPKFDLLRAAIFAELDTMLSPFVDRGAEYDGFSARLALLKEDMRAVDSTSVPGSVIDRIAATDRKRADSLHLLVMDVHKALNRLQASFAEGSIDGALVFGLGDGDEELVKAFMRGVGRTAPLKFDHPGLGTTATRAGDRLIIQNDIGTTDAHVMVIHVDPDAIRITYSDVHLPRLSFFCGLCPENVGTWDETQVRESDGLAEGRPFYVVVGTFPARDSSVRCRDLELIGSRLVFLIDWNKARKRLLRFFDSDAAVELLKWAADEDVGHRGFLQLGGERLVYDAVEAASGGQVRYGESLQDMLGEEKAVGFLRFVLRAASTGLSQGRSETLIRDQIRTELLNHFQSREQHLLDLCLDHAGFVLQIAEAVREAIAILGTPMAAAGADRQARRAKAWERSADDKLIALRERAHGKADALMLRRLVETADDAADGLEEAAYTISLFPGNPPTAKFQQPLQQMAALLVEAAREWIKALANAATLHRQSGREEADDFLVAIDCLARIERDTDKVQRRVTAALIADNPEYREFYLVTEIARHLEEAADSLMRAAMLLHDGVLGQMMPK